MNRPKEPHIELENPPSEKVDWVGWSRSNPNRVGRASAKLWFDAREAIMKELGVGDTGLVEVIRNTIT